MKKIIPMGALLCAVIPSLASATVDIPQGWYIRGAWVNPNFAVKDSSLAAALGYKKHQWRFEGEYGFQYNRDRFGFRSRMDDPGINLYYDFDNSSIFSPYVGLGVHYGYYKQWYAPYKDFAFEKHQLHLTGALGVRAYLSHNLALDVGYHQGYEGGALSIGAALHFD